MIGSMIRQVVSAIELTFRGEKAPLAYAILLGLGTIATAFYLVMLPSSAVGGLSLAALHYLTMPLASAAVVLGYGFALAIAINLGAFSQRSRTAEVAGVGGLLAAMLPGSLCCTSLVPTALAAFGASATTVLGTTGKIQSVFAQYEGAFIVASIVGVLLSIVLAARNRISACAI
jgi:asparagine N-glycosylation enzyme membrane subunit Stt3